MKLNTYMEDSSKNKFQGYDGQTSAGLNGHTISPDSSPSEILASLLSIQCLLLQAEEGAILRLSDDRKVDVLAVYPATDRKKLDHMTWVVQSAESIRNALSSDNVIVTPLRSTDQPRGRQTPYNIYLIRLDMNGIGQAAGAFLVEKGDRKSIETKGWMLQLLAKLLNFSEMRLLQQKGTDDSKRFQQAMKTLSVTNSKNQFTQVAMAFCNEVASQWQCERATIGFLKGRYVQVKAISHTEEFSRKMEIVQTIESAMEECLDQDVEILSPAPEAAAYICSAANELSNRFGALTVLSLPLRRDGEVFAAVTLERPANRIFSPDEIETLRLTCELCTARLADLYEHGRWFGATMAIKGRNLLSSLLGPKQTSAKLAIIICTGVILFFIFGKGQFRPEAPFVMEATYQQVIPAPFDGYIKGVEVEVNEPVESNHTVLARLDATELILQLAALKAEKSGYLKQASAAMRDGEIAQAQIAEANADKVTAQIDLLNYQVRQADIVSPISGIVVKGDLKRQIGAPVKTGDVLFEVSPLDSLRAELLVPEDEIYNIKAGQEGQLATASFPEKRISFIVERINPVAEVVNQRNVFKVRVNLMESYTWIRPGMEGISRVSVGKRRYAWIWTRKAVNWIRMKLWI